VGEHVDRCRGSDQPAGAGRRGRGPPSATGSGRRTAAQRPQRRRSGCPAALIASWRTPTIPVGTLVARALQARSGRSARGRWPVPMICTGRLCGHVGEQRAEADRQAATGTASARPDRAVGRTASSAARAPDPSTSSTSPPGYRRPTTRRRSATRSCAGPR
jgi:hypothetical protein